MRRAAPSLRQSPSSATRPRAPLRGSPEPSTRVAAALAGGVHDAARRRSPQLTRVPHAPIIGAYAPLPARRSAMPLYLVEHQHSAETCPTSNPEMVQGLAQHMKPESAARNQVELLGECVIPGEHHLIA